MRIFHLLCWAFLVCASPAGAITICAGTCPIDPATPPTPVPSVEVDWSFRSALAPDAGEALSLGVVGNVYVAAPDGAFAAFQLTLQAAAIHVVAPIGLSADDFIVLDFGAPDGSEAQAVVGDVYIEVHEPLGTVVVRATGTTVVTGQALSFVPEPRGGPLTAAGGLGLLVLARTRARARTPQGQRS